MFIKDMFKAKKPVLSLEVFPPKEDADFEELFRMLGDISVTAPDFISVTCGAGGTGATGERTRKVASALKNMHSVEPLAHLTCINSDAESVSAAVSALKGEGVSNILALRGDIPEGMEDAPRHYTYAARLIRELSVIDGLCVGAACYPEGHIDCGSMAENLRHMREKQDAGAAFFTTQMFFDNEMFYRFIEKARQTGITAPVTAGIMPVRSRATLEKMVFTCGASLPSALIKLIHRYEKSPADLRKAGLEYAVKQMEGLRQNGADGIHIYMMNRPHIAKTALARLRGE